MDALQSARREMIEAGGRTAESFGLNRLHGQIFMLLYLAEAPLSLEEVARELGVSKASASISCRQLESWGTLKKSWKKGDRRDFYSAETDPRHILNNGLLVSLNKKLNSAKAQIEISLQMLEQAGVAGGKADFLRNRLAQAEKYRAKIGDLINHPLLKAFM